MAGSRIQMSVRVHVNLPLPADTAHTRHGRMNVKLLDLSHITKEHVILYQSEMDTQNIATVRVTTSNSLSL